MPELPPGLTLARHRDPDTQEWYGLVGSWNGQAFVHLASTPGGGGLALSTMPTDVPMGGAMTMLREWLADATPEDIQRALGER